MRYRSVRVDGVAMLEHRYVMERTLGRNRPQEDWPERFWSL